MIYLVVFLAQTLVEVLFVAYLYCVEGRAPIKAAVLGSGCYAMNAFCVVMFIEDIYCLAAVVLGVFVGTIIVVEYRRRKDSK